MQIISLKLNNFKQYKETSINFNEGLTGLIGKNGAGKSSIFEAITLAFYGRFETNKETIKNDKAGTKDILKVELVFEDRGKSFKVIRELKGKNLKAEAEFFIDDISKAVGAKEVNKEILKVLKIDYSNFKNSFFASQKEVTSLINLSSKDKETSIRKMLGLEKLDKLDDNIKEKLKELNKEIKIKEENLLTEMEISELLKEKDELQKNLELKNNKAESEIEKLNSFKEKYDRLKEELKKSEILKKEYDSVNKNIEVVIGKIEETKLNILSADKEIKDLTKKYEEMKNLEAQKENYIKANKQYEQQLKIKSDFQKKIELEKRSEKLNEDMFELNTKKNEIKISIDKLNDFDQKLESHSELLKSKNETRKSIVKNSQLINDFISKINGEIEKSSKRLKRIEEIGRDSSCPECERPLDDHYDKLTQKYKSEIDQNKKDIALRKNELIGIEKELESVEDSIERVKKEIHHFETEIKRREELKENSDELDNKINKLQKEITETESDLRSLSEVKFEETKLVEFENLRDELQPYFEKYNDYKSKTENLPKKKSDLAELKNKLKDFDESLLKQKTNLSKINFEEESYEQLKLRREESENTFNELKENLHQIKSELIIIKNKIDEISKEIDKDEKEKNKIKDLHKKFNLLERLKSFVSEFKSRITSQELPAISNEASRLFASITKERYQNLRIDSSFNFLVNREDKEVELLTLSGGEKDSASLCLRVAISKRISALAGRTNMGFLALDEVFGSQDEDRREELLNALGKISNEFKQIFVVSHNQDVQEAFPQRLLIQKVNGFSTANFFSS